MQSETHHTLKNSAKGSVVTGPEVTSDDRDAYWNQLRRYYRTGLQPDSVPKFSGLTSVFKAVFEKVSTPYPVPLDEEEITLNELTLFQVLKHQHSVAQDAIRHEFKKKLNSLIEALSRRLSLEDMRQLDEENYDFATEMIAFDKLSELLPAQKKQVTEADHQRLIQVIKELREGLDWLRSQEALVIQSEEYAVSDATLPNSNLIKVSREDLMKETKALLKEQMIAFTLLIKAFRTAMLMVEDQYQEDIHGDYFTYFNWYNLKEAEKALFLPVILLAKATTLMSHYDELSSLVRTNWPIKLLVVNQAMVSEPINQLSWEEASHSSRQELAAFMIAHRNVSTFQLTLADPAMLFNSMKEWITSHHPVLLHVLMPSEITSAEVSLMQAAHFARYFPAVCYRPNAGIDDRWDMSNNPALTAHWPSLDLAVTKGDQTTELPLSFTYADYKAFFEQKVDELMIIPPEFETDHLVDVGTYLSLDEESLIGKIPYIWLTDAESKLYKAAIPNVWVVSCQERLDFWNFLREISGGTLSAASAADQPEREPEVEPGVSEQDLASIRQETLQQVTQRLINSLLN